MTIVHTICLLDQQSNLFDEKAILKGIRKLFVLSQEIIHIYYKLMKLLLAKTLKPMKKL